jgi:hypothetical protein
MEGLPRNVPLSSFAAYRWRSKTFQIERYFLQFKVSAHSVLADLLPTSHRPSTKLGFLLPKPLSILRMYSFSIEAGQPQTERVNQLMIETDSPRSEKVVIQFGTKTIKGYLDSPTWNTIEKLLSNAPPSPPESFRIRRLDSNQSEDISVKDVKAVFYVNSFEGDADHKHLNFHTRAPIVHGIWMRLKFLDGEVMEGIVFNSLRYLVDPGFFVLPTDPESNNKLVYVLKSWLVDHRVLGMRKL